MKWKCLLVDDEPYIRLILRKVIEKTEEFTVCAESGSLQEALSAFQEEKPDVVFMDIELAGSSGIEGARAMLAQNPDVFLIFATAYAEYMPDAFELYAFDYLVKPFDMARILHTLERIKKQKEKEGAQPPDKLMLKKKDSIDLVNVDDIVFVAHEKTVTCIYTENGCYETSRSLTELEKILPPPEFVRCHRSYLIRVSRIQSLEPYGRWTYLVRFQGTDQTAYMTKENFDKLKEKWSS